MMTPSQARWHYQGESPAPGRAFTNASDRALSTAWQVLKRGVFDSGKSEHLNRVQQRMTRAVFDGVVLADSEDVRVVEGMTYFPRDSVRAEALVESTTTSRCFWKGKARYWHVVGRTETESDAAFAYDRPWPLARRLVTDRVAFWRGVEVEDD